MRSIAATKLWRVSHGPSDLRLRWRRAFRAAFLLCAPFIFLYTAFRLIGIRINLTSSLERGFYIVSRTPSANLAEFCPEGDAATISLQRGRSEEHTSELQSQFHLVCRLLLEKKKKSSYRFSLYYPTKTKNKAR